ncbi:hypothetical protein AB0H58_29640 [Nocardia neocaledoniensis]|uniref:hypothetical protein n=1 Tax=Nocardia neocaledoniensis TaxID=236511 RepID=UPI0024577B63|nr:hypothetical protein [Nocardia neocaledoniensis]
MNVRGIGAGSLLVTAALLLGAPAAHAADTGSADPLGPSGSGGQINLGCLLESLSAGPPTASCDPVQIPTP